MSLLRTTLTTLAFASAFGLSGCNSGQENANPQASPAGTTTVAKTSVQTSGNVLTAAQVNVKMTLQGNPTITADGQSIAVGVDVINNGTTTLGAIGIHPVNLGAHSVDGNGKVVNNDLARAGLPNIAPGSQAVVTILLPLKGILNKSGQILPVQEGVHWFDVWGTKPLTVGPFSNCSHDANEVCGADGKPLATTAVH